MKLPAAPPRYDRAQHQQLINTLERDLANSQKSDRDIRVGPARRLVLQSPDGSQFALEVDNSGNLSAVPIA